MFSPALSKKQRSGLGGSASGVGGDSGDGNFQHLEQTVLCPGSLDSAEPRGLKLEIAWCNTFPRRDQDKCDLC